MNGSSKQTTNNDTVMKDKNTSRSLTPDDIAVDSPGQDGISSLSFCPYKMTPGTTGTDFLVSSNWDGGVRVWEVKHTPPSGLLSKASIQTTFKGQTMHANNAPVLSACFTTDGIVSGGCDKAVRLWRLDGSTPLNTVSPHIGFHDAPVKSVRYLKDKGLVVSGGWDSKVKFWDCTVFTSGP